MASTKVGFRWHSIKVQQSQYLVCEKSENGDEVIDSSRLEKKFEILKVLKISL